MSAFPVIKNHIVVGNLTGDPELRFTPSGAPVASFSIAETARVRQEDGTYVDGDTTFYNASAWRSLAENVAETLTKGMTVVAVGELSIRTYTNRDGEEKQSIDFNVRQIGPSLQFATAVVTKNARGNSAGQTTSRRRPQEAPAQDDGDAPEAPPAQEKAPARGGRQQRPAAPAPSDDPWG